MRDSTSLPIIAALIGATGVLASVWVAHRLAARREDRADERTVQREAASALSEALQSIRRLVEHSRLHPVEARTVHEAVDSWETVYRKYQTRIPEQGRHVRRSVAAAIGTHFGAVGASNLIPEASDFDVTDHDAIWGENADSYLAYLIDRLSRWYDKPEAVSKLKILDFDAWLSEVGRRN